MFRSVVAAVAALAAGAALGALGACNQTDNDRPLSVQYITEAILQPNCGQDVCHSSYTRAKGYAFDTVDAAKQSLKTLVSAEEPDSSLILTVLTRKVKRMPYDAPLPDKDIALIQEWLERGDANRDLGL